MSHFLIAYRYLHRKCCNTIRSVNDIIFRSIITQFSKGSTYINLNTFCHTLTHLHVMLAAHVFLNISSKIITGNADRIIRNNTSQ